MSRRTMATLISLISLVSLVSLVFAAACGGDEAKVADPAPPTVKNAATNPGALYKPLPGKAIPPAELLAGVQQELAAMRRILDRGAEGAKALGKMNASFQRRGYFRRVPTGPALAGMRADLRRLATETELRMVGLDAVPSPPRQQRDTVLTAGKRWEPKLDDLRGVVQLTMDLQGLPPYVAAFINRLPGAVERMILVTGDESIPGGVRLMAEAYYEHPRQAQDVTLAWPTLRERLLTAGWDPADPALKSEPAMAPLRKAVAQGRMLVPQVRAALKVVSDFPRWMLREAFFEERSMRVASVRGEILLGTTLPGQ